MRVKKNLKIGLIVQLIVSGAPLMADLFIPEFAVMLGADRFQIGIMGTFFASAMFFSAGIFGRLSDIFGRKKILLLGFLLSGLFYGTSFLVRNFSGLFVLRILQGTAVGIYPGALAAYVHESTGSMDDYAMAGAFGIAAFLGVSGLIASIKNIRWIFLFVALFYGISLLLFLEIGEEFGEKKKLPLFPLNAIRENLHTYLAIFLTFSGISITWTYWVLYLKNAGIPSYEIGLVTAINPFFEFVTLLIVNGKTRFGGTKAGILTLAAVYPLFALAKSVPVIVILQIVSGIGWAFMFAGGLNDVIKGRGNEKGTATGLFQSSVSLGNIAGPFLGGIISLFFKNLGAMFVFAGLVIFAGFALLQIHGMQLKKRIS